MDLELSNNSSSLPIEIKEECQTSSPFEVSARSTSDASSTDISVLKIKNSLSYTIIRHEEENFDAFMSPKDKDTVLPSQKTVYKKYCNKVSSLLLLRTSESKLEHVQCADGSAESNGISSFDSSFNSDSLETEQLIDTLFTNNPKQGENKTVDKQVTHDLSTAGDISPRSSFKKKSLIPEFVYPNTYCSRRKYISYSPEIIVIDKEVCASSVVYGYGDIKTSVLVRNLINQNRGRRLKTKHIGLSSNSTIDCSVSRYNNNLACNSSGDDKNKKSIMENVTKPLDTVGSMESVQQNGLPTRTNTAVDHTVALDTDKASVIGSASTLLRPTTLDKSISPTGSSSDAGVQLSAITAVSTGTAAPVKTAIPAPISPKTPRTPQVAKPKSLATHIQHKSEHKHHPAVAHIINTQQQQRKADIHSQTSLPATPKFESAKGVIVHNNITPTLIKTTDIIKLLSETKEVPKTPPVTPDTPAIDFDDDIDSMYSFETTTSGRSTMSCEHPYVARNGTTFSGRQMKYVVHCSNYAGQVGSDYLTPTQRAQRQVRRLKELLCVARSELEVKDSEILRLTREVVELRLFKASLSSPEERSASSDAVTVREAELKTSQDVSPIVDMVDDGTKTSPRHVASLTAQPLHQQLQQTVTISSEMQSSYADSGHYEDLTTSSVHSKEDSYTGKSHDIACGNDEAAGVDTSTAHEYELQRQELIRMYEQRIEDLIRSQDNVSSEVKRTHNDKVEALLQKLAECNTRYADMVPDYEHAKERIRELEKQLEELQRRLAEQEDKHNKMYLHMYQKGQEAERLARADQALELAYRAPTNKVSINELLIQLQSTQDELENIRTIYRRLLDAQKNRSPVDPEVTLQFLKSAIYYFLTDKENSQGHLQVIESILEFTEAEKQNISKARLPK